MAGTRLVAGSLFTLKRGVFPARRRPQASVAPLMFRISDFGLRDSTAYSTENSGKPKKRALWQTQKTSATCAALVWERNNTRDTNN